MRVVVYKNLNRGDWSVAEVSGRTGRGRVIAHRQSIVLVDVTFHVQPSAQAKVQAGAARSVHAWAIGDMIYAESGRKAGIAMNNRDQGRVNFERDWMTRAVALESTGTDARLAREAWAAAYTAARRVG